ncbi:MAG TPA: ABC transporter ATP-binding protein [Thermotogota bacterium]|nr:ABC transporter ATP-binding protein [Thermotogota bacterium]HPJ89021.1 ABC transporter ATP-binding protein [Thermotogota bacterium]HPR95532.1 ABC transporter ATP-binding protein [Thermotogota bacterium]
MLKLEEVKLKYGYVEALKGISLEIKGGTITCLLGANGAGKSTTLRAISGLNHAYDGKILFNDEEIQDKSPDNIVKRRIIHCPEGRKLFPGLSVHENLMAGAYVMKDKNRIKENLEEVYQMFPILADRRRQSAGTLSGGEQQMLAVGRALMADPELLMLDEPSLGLAPIIFEQIFDTLIELKKQGKTIFLVEQNANAALHISDYAYIIEVGSITLEGNANELLKDDRVKEKYLGG